MCEGMGIVYIILSVENHEVINICGIIWGGHFLSGVLLVELRNVPSSQEFSCILYSTHTHICVCVLQEGGTRRRSWLRHCASSQKVAGSIPDGVIVNFHCHNPSGNTMALGSTQPLTEMSTGYISWGVKVADA